MEKPTLDANAWAVGFDLGGTNLRGALVSTDGQVQSRKSRRTLSHRGPDAVIDDITGIIEEILAEAPSKPVGIGLASPGPLDPEKGVIINSPNLRWTNIPLKDHLDSRLELTTTVDNDSQMTAFGERWQGAGQGADHLLCLTLGTGVGGGVILNGRIYHGETGSAGHVGHYIIDPLGPRCGCGAQGCLEAYASGPNIVRRTREAIEAGRLTRIPELVEGGLDQLTSLHIYNAARDGDALALDIFQETGHRIAHVLASLIPILDPQVVVISGQVALAGELLLEPVRSRLAAIICLRPPVPVVQGLLGDNGGLVGAAGVVLAQAGLLP